MIQYNYNINKISHTSIKTKTETVFFENFKYFTLLKHVNSFKSLKHKMLIK